MQQQKKQMRNGTNDDTEGKPDSYSSGAIPLDSGSGVGTFQNLRQLFCEFSPGFKGETMGILEKISEIEKEIARTQKNKGWRLGNNLKLILVHWFPRFMSMVPVDSSPPRALHDSCPMCLSCPPPRRASAPCPH